ncbi:alpha/beta hydrolase family protein [Daejeonella oryzae]|uniref:alpha/beta hydrolase family protein n=1 Tax=Daejeonella oryzae TaxID=1122943 RepID=UPI0004230579|nr:prolyl oligopeptidase family serine peptidase [Daejeonella oryzae]
MKLNLLAFAGFIFLKLSAFAQEELTYQTPPQSIIDLVDAPTTPEIKLNSDGSWMLLLQKPGLPPISEVAQPELRIAGLRINPATNGQSRSAYFNGIKLKSVKKNEEFEFTGLPEILRISDVSWSPDESKIAFSNLSAYGIELWVADIKTLEAKKLSESYLNDTYGTPFIWSPGSKSLLAKFVDTNRADPPLADLRPTGPIVQENIGKTAPSRTYQDLLKNPYQELLFDYYLSSQMKIVPLEGEAADWNIPAIYKSFDFSPDGKHILIQTINRPYSYMVPANLFPYTTAVYNVKGKLVKTFFKAPLADNIPSGFDGVPKGPREFGWRTDKASTLFWVEAKDEGDPNRQVPLRDVIYMLEAPFKKTAQKLAECYLRFNNIDWADDDLAIVTERWWKTRAERRVYIKPGNASYRVNLFDRYYENAYSDPGKFVIKKNAYKRDVLLTENQNIFTISNGASPEGDRPFLLKFNIKTKLTDTLFHSQAPYYEKPVFFNNTKFLIISRESADSVANYYHVKLADSTYTQLTDFTNPYPGLAGVIKQQLNYKRLDGLNLSATLYLPKNYSTSDGALPVLMWAYPREFKTALAAGQVKGSPYQFTRISSGSPIYWVNRGYAILDNADMPIVGESNDQPNDTFIEQIRYNAQAAIDTLVKMGVADSARIAVGGHSYGAFMTANLLAHTDLFAAGIARSGAYNRTLTPFGFQAEERTYWEAPEVYNKMSPFSYADKIKEPLLLIHGEADNNSGTFPMQSERFYNALKGHGATTRLVILPAEAHGYQGRESVLHMMWEMDNWLEKYVKKAKPEKVTK